ncbi:MAG: response regulator, partial [Candidatus Omnitrophica bacterium]|nr:response regulator [Candidatus Omnitrophota bacterium]
MSKKIILIAEDEPYIREVIKAMLDEIGNFEIIEASDAGELVDFARKVHPDLIITDVIMPGNDAYHALGELKKDEEFKNIPVIFESALMSDRAVFETHAPPGRSFFLVKPFKF